MKNIKHFLSIKLYWIKNLYKKITCFIKGHKPITYTQEMPSVRMKFKSIKLCSRCGEWE